MRGHPSANKKFGLRPTARMEIDTMATTKKMTKREMFAQILSHTTDEAEKAFIAHEMELLDKKNSAKATKLTPAQEANEGIKSAIVDYLAEVGEPMTISQMLKDIPQCQGMSNQKVSALVRQLTMAMTVKRAEVKGVAYFSIA